MKKSILFIVLGLMLTTGLKAQVYEEPRNPKLEIHWMPLSILDFTPHYRFGAEYRVIPHASVGLDLSYGHSGINVFTNGKYGNNYEFTEFRPDIKYFMIDHKRFSMYVGTEAYYLKATDVLKNDYYVMKTTGQHVYYDQSDYSKEKSGVNMKLGVKLTANQRIVFDIYTGLGYATRTDKYTNVILSPDQTDYDRWNWFGRQRDEGEYSFYNFLLGFKFGVAL